jgi:hypothetical protein
VNKQEEKTETTIIGDVTEAEMLEWCAAITLAADANDKKGVRDLVPPGLVPTGKRYRWQRKAYHQ